MKLDSPAPTPSRISKLSEREILLEWKDGEAYSLPFEELRFQCPCAGCVDEQTGARVIRRESITPGVRPRNVGMVGQYALGIQWSDGHNSGLYPFDRLYEICLDHGRKH